MNEIRMMIGYARRRLEAAAFLSWLHVTAIIVAGFALALSLADRAPAESFVAWTWVWPVLAVICVGLAAMLWSRRRLDELKVAVAVDDRLELRERLSTALHCYRRDDPFAQAAVQDAVTTARDPRTRERLRRGFAIAAPGQWWISPLLVLVTVGVLMLPQADLFARDEEPDPTARLEAEQEANQAIEAIQNALEDKPELRDSLADLVDDMMKAGSADDPLIEPEEVKRDALKKVTELNRRLDEIVTGEQGKTSKAVKEMLAKLQTPEDGPAKELADALAKGDFKEAQKALEKMLGDLNNGEMNAAQQEQMAQQLADLANQLQQLAQQQEALQQALQQAGLNPQLANNPQALQQAIQNAQNLNEQQKQQLQQMAKAQQQACQMCQGLGGACQQMAQAMQQGQQGQMNQAGQQMGDQLNQIEQLQQLLQQAELAMGQCQGQCKGLGKGLNMDQALQQWMQGGGMGDWGQGEGGQGPMRRTPSGFKAQKEDVPIVPGEIIASMLVDGTPIRGELKSKLKEVTSTVATGSDEAQEQESLPRPYHEVIQHYFGELEKQVDATTVEGDETEGDTTPAEEGDGGGDEGGSSGSGPEESGSSG